MPPIEILQQIWFPITALLAVLALLVFALNQRARQRRRNARRPVILTSADAYREEER